MDLQCEVHVLLIKIAIVLRQKYLNYKLKQITENIMNISDKLKDCLKIEAKKIPESFKLENYQKKPFEILSKPNHDSLLLVYQTGAGKTLTACFTAIQLLDKKAKIKIVGIRPGEKMHESLFSIDESRSVNQDKDSFIIYSENLSFSSKYGKKLKNETEYRS